jgi:outer membrane protein
VKYTIAAILLPCLAVLAGCATLDPWGVMDGTPRTLSQSFQADLEQSLPDGALESAFSDDLATRTLSLGECVEIALERNPQTSVSWQAARAAAAEVGRVKGEYLPAIGFSSRATRSDPAELENEPQSTGAGATGGTNDPGPQNRYEATFGLRYLLFDGGGRKARLAGAEAVLLALNFRHNAVLQDIALSVEEAYNNLLASRSFEEVAAETVRQREYQLRMAEARHEVGLVARSDVLKAQTEKADADLALVRARNDVHLAGGRLVTVMGLPVSTGIRIAEMPEEDLVQTFEEIESLLDEAARNRPELKVALAQVQAENAGVKLARSAFWPSAAIDTAYGWVGRDLLPNQSQWALGLDIDLPLFSGFSNTYRLSRAKSDLARTIAERHDLLQGIELEVWTAYWQSIEASQAIDAACGFVASADESARVAEGEYKNRTDSSVDPFWRRPRPRLPGTG